MYPTHMQRKKPRSFCSAILVKRTYRETKDVSGSEKHIMVAWPQSTCRRKVLRAERLTAEKRIGVKKYMCTKCAWCKAVRVFRAVINRDKVAQ